VTDSVELETFATNSLMFALELVWSIHGSGRVGLGWVGSRFFLT